MITFNDKIIKACEANDLDVLQSLFDMDEDIVIPIKIVVTPPLTAAIAKRASRRIRCIVRCETMRLISCRPSCVILNFL
jgi:hypothetical protein